MTAVRFEPAVAVELLEALRLFEGRLAGSGRRMSLGLLEIRSAAERSLEVTRDQSRSDAAAGAEDGGVLGLLTIQEVCGALHVSESTVKRAISTGALVAVRVGRSVRVRPSDLGAYIDALNTVVESDSGQVA